MVATNTHDYVITAAGVTYSGDINLDLDEPFVNSPSQPTALTTTDQALVNTFLTAIHTLFTGLRGMDDIHVTVKNRSNLNKKTP